MMQHPSQFLAPILAATMTDPGAVLTSTLRLARLARRWGLGGAMAGLLAALAYGDTPDE